MYPLEIVDSHEFDLSLLLFFFFAISLVHRENTEVENTLEGALVLYRIKVSLDRASLGDGIESTGSTESAAEPLVTLETFLHGN